MDLDRYIQTLAIMSGFWIKVIELANAALIVTEHGSYDSSKLTKVCKRPHDSLLPVTRVVYLFKEDLSEEEQVFWSFKDQNVAD